MRAVLLSLVLLPTVAAAGPAGIRPVFPGGQASCLVSLLTCSSDLDVCEADVADLEIGLDTCWDEVDGAYAEIEALAALLAVCEDPTIPARTGGVATSEDGAAFVSVPPGVLPKDLAITVEPVARPVVDAPRASGVYDVSPDGSSFPGRVTVCLATNTDPGPDACLGYLDESKSPPAWKCEDECLAKSGPSTWCGTTDHFTDFAILLSGSSGKGGCEDDDDGFVIAWKPGVGASFSLGDGWARIELSPTAGPVPGSLHVARGAEPPDEEGAVSHVVDVSLFDDAGKAVTQLTDVVEICLKAGSTSPDEACLGFYDERSGTWECEDPCLAAEDGRLCGKTDHFTSFAILLSGGRANGTCGAP